MAATIFVPVLAEISLVQAVISGLAVYVSFVFVRQRYFSVIGNIPGPFLGTFGTCFQLWEISRGHINQKLAQLHTEHGMTLPEFYRPAADATKGPSYASATTKSVSTTQKPYRSSRLLSGNRTGTDFSPCPTLTITT